MLLALWYLANTESFRQVSDRFGISLSSAHRILSRVINFILSLIKDYIKWTNDEEKKNISSNFKTKHGFDGVIGLIDGSHIKINKPHEVYINRKGYHSILLQGIVNHQKLFLDVYCGEPGSLHDARLLRKSKIYEKAEDPTFFGNYYLLGDSAYPVLSWLIPPFKDTGFLSREQKEFNYKLSATRVTIENAFGLLKGHFRCLGHFENFNIKFIVKIIVATCVLHNICILEDDLIDTEFLENDQEHQEVVENEEPQNQNLNKRQKIFEKMYNVNH